jgi:hypothetical protein
MDYTPKTFALRGQEITLCGSRARIHIDDTLRRPQGSILQILVPLPDGGEKCIAWIPLPRWGYARQRAWAKEQGFSAE